MKIDENLCKIELGRVLGPLGPSWGALLASLSVLGPSWERLGAAWGHLGASWERLGRILGRLGGRPGGGWRASWAVL